MTPALIDDPLSIASTLAALINVASQSHSPLALCQATSVGLEIAEILMDLEDEFCVIIDHDESEKFGTLVLDFENMVVKRYSIETLSATLNEIIKIEDLNNSDRYEKLQVKQKWLPQPRFRFLHIFLRRINKNELKSRIENAINNYKDENSVRAGVRNLITKRLYLKSPALSNQDLIKDLGCG